MNSPEARPKLSVVVICCEMAGEITNTLRSLLPPYQRNIATDDYEITLIENGFHPNAAGTSAHGPSTPILQSKYENIRIGALKARPRSKH
jgi:hypothetical protein